jgi:thymidine phosphorylase
MIPAEVIRRKRDGHALSREEIAFAVKGISDGGLSDAQVGSRWRSSSRAWRRTSASH